MDKKNINEKLLWCNDILTTKKTTTKQIKKFDEKLEELGIGIEYDISSSINKIDKEKVFELHYAKELQAISKVIERMAFNSLMVKILTVILSSVIFATLQVFTIANIIAIGIIILLLSFLDMYYLSKERGFRNYYDIIRLYRSSLNHEFYFRITTSNKPFFLTCITSPSVYLFYSVFIILVMLKV